MSAERSLEKRDVPIAEVGLPAAIAHGELRTPAVRLRLRLAAAAEVCAIWVIAFWQLVQHAPPGTRLVASLLCALSFVLSVVIWRDPFVRAESVLGSGPAIALGAFTTGVVWAAAGFMVPDLRIGPWELVVTVVLSAAAVRLIQAAAGASPPSRVLVVGGGSGTDELVDALRSSRQSRFEISGMVAEERFGLPTDFPQWGVVELREAVLATGPDLVIVAVDEGRPQVFELLADVAEQGFRVVGLPEFFEHAYGRVPIRHLNPAWFMSVLHLYQRPYSRTAKRAFDVTVALAGLALILPLLPAIALLVLSDGRPIIFRQERLGEHGRVFTILKFRTMQQNAERNGAVWASDADPRITPFGRVLRKMRLDELPQLWNVLRGDMSIVGPRPERPEFLPRLEEAMPYWTRRHLLKPGITGWAQISSGYSDDEMGAVDKLSYDLWYLRHRSILVDLMICLRTVPHLFTGKGAR